MAKETPLLSMLRTGAEELLISSTFPGGGRGPTHISQAFCRVIANRSGENYDIKGLLDILSTDTKRGEDRLDPLMKGIEGKKGTLRSVLSDIFNQDRALMGVPPNGSPTLLHLSAAKANSPAASYFTEFIRVALEASHRGKEGLLDERLEICRRILSQASATVKLVDGILIEKTDGKASSADAPPHWLADCEEDWWQEFCEGLCRLLGRVEEHAEQEDCDAAYGVPLLMHLVRWLSVGWYLLLLNSPLAWQRGNDIFLNAGETSLNKYPLYLVPERCSGDGSVHARLTKACLGRIQDVMNGNNLKIQILAGLLRAERSPLKGRDPGDVLTSADIERFSDWLADTRGEVKNPESGAGKKQLKYEDDFQARLSGLEGEEIRVLIDQVHELLKAAGTLMGVVQVDKPAQLGWTLAEKLGLAGPRLGNPKYRGFYVQPELFESIYFALVSIEEREDQRRLQQTFHSRLKKLGLHVGGSGTSSAMTRIGVSVPLGENPLNPDHLNQFYENRDRVEEDLVSKDLVRKLADGVTVVGR